ncbi:MAG: hypothetical protein LBS67_04045, partial [Clostridiales Family XIII bacterium]|nr:hypothetical protein [Clostridiales Family XIII bacterium]
MKDVNVAIVAASFNGNKGAAAMLQSSIKQLWSRYGHQLNINLMSTYPADDRRLNPYDFVKVVSCKPGKLVFLAFPLSIVFKLLSWLPPAKSLLKKNKVIRAFCECDLVIDESGVSFVDSRGPVMNLYAFVTIATPLLL